MDELFYALHCQFDKCCTCFWFKETFPSSKSIPPHPYLSPQWSPYPRWEMSQSCLWCHNMNISSAPGWARLSEVLSGGYRSYKELCTQHAPSVRRSVKHQNNWPGCHLSWALLDQWFHCRTSLLPHNYPQWRPLYIRGSVSCLVSCFKISLA